MFKKKLIIITIFLLLIPIFWWLGRFRFSNDYLIVRDIPFEKINKIKCGFWKQSGGYHIIDFMEFDEDNYCKIKNDTLYIAGKPEAKVISLIHRCLINDYDLTVQSFDGQIGYYTSK